MIIHTLANWSPNPSPSSQILLKVSDFIKRKKPINVDLSTFIGM